MTERIEFIKKAVEKSAGCEAVHVGSELVVEVFRGKTMWEGVIEVFDLVGHPRAKRAYGWSDGQGKNARYTAVIEIPPVDSPNTAVRAAIASAKK